MLNLMKRTAVRIDKSGRIVLPKQLRNCFHLRGGDSLEINVRGDAIELRPAWRSGELRRVNGILVFHGGGTFPFGNDLVASSREERIADLIRRGQIPKL